MKGFLKCRVVRDQRATLRPQVRTRSITRAVRRHISRAVLAPCNTRTAGSTTLPYNRTEQTYELSYERDVHSKYILFILISHDNCVVCVQNKIQEVCIANHNKSYFGLRTCLFSFSRGTW